MDAEKRILLVEDNPRDEFLTLEAFRQLDLQDSVLALRDGSEALDYLFCSGSYSGGCKGALPELILMDLELPYLNGIEVLDRIRADARTRLIPVVIFTGSDSRRDLVAGYLGGANSFVRKPVDFMDYVQVLQHLWHYWSKVNVLPSTLFPTPAETV
jgi:CheY-like chemotaxis protein